MISGIGNSASYWSSLFATNNTSSSSATSGSTSLTQTEQQLFAGIDTDGDGGISQSEFTRFLNQTAQAAGNTSDQTQAANALFAKMSGGSGSISLQQFEADAGDLVTQLQSEIAAGSASAGSASSSATSSLLSQLAQSAQSLASGSAASIATPSSSQASSNNANTSNGQSHHHHGREVGSSLISQFMQQYQAAGATSSAAAPMLSASA